VCVCVCVRACVLGVFVNVQKSLHRFSRIEKNSELCRTVVFHTEGQGTDYLQIQIQARRKVFHDLQFVCNKLVVNKNTRN
jgi:hypothetical protein